MSRRRRPAEPAEHTGHAEHAERGSALVDFTLVTLVLVPLVLGLLQVALVLHVRATLAAAASEGARLAATADRGPGDGVARTRAQIADALAGRYAEDVEVHQVLVGGAPGVEIVVRAEVPALGIAGPAVAMTVTGRAVEEDPR
ncbi:TadE/TadG family type IV pilus assembly protein [Nocardioides daeguensis]|uniref:TadE-like domain-containing protein n=1 Tax=Nocardioides daeguensis TaxID=908359 RepID=A0ABP6W723_9ACTN|nr:TadE/TadG family type IV pilus assembly protein [Nocardioides daeguensis]MBV6729288.1 pilus assembly protein [Nocardioides daeguensis]MCR1774264.1 pilus assembly protein [Nocardioides daeguensis]